MRNRGGVFFGLAAALGLGCSGPSLDVPERPDTGVGVDFEPALSDSALPLVFRARLHGAPASGTPWLFRGEVSDYYARSLKRAEIPSALRDRAVQLRYWRDANDCWLQPVEWLEPDATYTLALAGTGVVRVLQTGAAHEPSMRRLFPPPGRDKFGVSVMCELPDDGPWSAMTLEPGGIALRVASGMAGQPRPGCVTLQVDGTLREAVVAPPVLAGAMFEPSPWLPLPPGAADVAPPCSAGEAFHGACLEVLDDRLRVTATTQDLLFAVQSPETATGVARVGARSLLLGGLTPSRDFTLGGTVLSSAGALESFRTDIRTAPARRHLVLNEVLANPVGPEPDAEWLELVNDSVRPASLSGLWLEDSGGHVALPDEGLGPGEIALLVSDDFRASGLDAPIPDGVRLLRVASLGARGLANGGEALLLVGPEGVVSRFPLLAAPHAGRSLARRTLDGADDDPAGFSEQPGVGATPGAPNFFDD